MHRDDVHPNGGISLCVERSAQAATGLLDRRAGRRLVARALLVALLFGSVGAGALVDLGLRWLGLRWFPVFTLLWGGGALLAVGVGWTRFERSLAAARASNGREDR